MNIFALCATAPSFDTLRCLGNVPLAGVIGLLPKDPSTISGFNDGIAVCKALNVPLLHVDDYSLKSNQVRQVLQDLPIDVLLVLGWQRLVPQWLLERCRIGAVGCHCSPFSITEGRGRAPLNWAFILGERALSTYIFWLTAGMDDGPIIGSHNFPLTDVDDASSCYAKISLSLGKLIRNAYISGALNAVSGQPQPAVGTYLPRRTPDDGKIDWRRSTIEIRNFIAALSRPYPGAWTLLQQVQFTLWRARPFELDVFDSAFQPGNIVFQQSAGPFVVATGDGYLYIDDYSVAGPFANSITGQSFQSADFAEQQRAIAARHLNQFPQLPLASKILGTLSGEKSTGG